MLKTKNKDGEMTIATIVAIALAVVVLIFLIYGFTTGWNDLFGKITAIGGGSSNVDTIALGCATAASTQSSSYCNTPQDLIDANKDKIVGTCHALAHNGIITPTTTMDCLKTTSTACTIDKKPSANCKTVDEEVTTPRAGDECGTDGKLQIATCDTTNQEIVAATQVAGFNCCKSK
ncbi:DUF2909 domain-containing protein [archaeon]|jgi:hypothetical protein|nr:DUF2909 domain-containing protein [archaeon]